jgi:hypothetical protein
MSNVLYVVQQSLARGHLNEAIQTLETAQHHIRGEEQAKLKLYVASLYGLEREKGLDAALHHLNEAVACYAPIVETALYKALAWQLAAYQGESLQRVRSALAQVLSSGKS